MDAESEAAAAGTGRMTGTRPFYEAIAPYYDADYAAIGYEADVPFYVGLACDAGGPVLEMGCGTGRVLLPTARAGVHIHGMDQASAMLAELRKKLADEPESVRSLVRLTEGDIRMDHAPGEFALVTAPFRVLQTLVEREDERAFLRNVRRHLAPGGVLCFDVFQPDFRYLTEPRGPTQEAVREDAAAGTVIRRVNWTVPHPSRQTIDVRFDWITEDKAGRELDRRSATTILRWFTRGEIESLLELEGFRITDYWGSFQHEPFGETSAQQVVRAEIR